jgi:hypothetical protein
LIVHPLLPVSPHYCSVLTLTVLSMYYVLMSVILTKERIRYVYFNKIFSYTTPMEHNSIFSRCEEMCAVGVEIWYGYAYRYTPHNDVSVNDGPHI